ncbi:hypothetical protein F5Y07DRAFT_369322 [Xylaria sp. FL0933]|nr:hypothetical protein F5Y07DRAFT_369322 [Xylaria sp. FL0933]
MQLNTILGALFAAAVSGAAVEPRDAVVYDVHGFVADCTPHSVTCGYGFRVVPSSDAPGSNGTICGNIVNGPDYLPPLPLTACFTNPKIAYSIAIPEDGGLALTITSALDAHTNVTGTHIVPADQLILTQGSISVSQHYEGPTNFTIPTSEVAV